jgi:hypothetical protein
MTGRELGVIKTTMRETTKIGFMWSSHDVYLVSWTFVYSLFILKFLTNMHTPCTNKGTRVSPDLEILTLGFAEVKLQMMEPL